MQNLLDKKLVSYLHFAAQATLGERYFADHYSQIGTASSEDIPCLSFQLELEQSIKAFLTSFNCEAIGSKASSEPA